MTLSPTVQRIIFMDSLPAKNMAKTSQILTTIDADNYDDTFRNRLTHSIEVGEFCRLISINLEMKKERVEENVNVGLAHDLGHPPFGHEGAEILDECLIEAGLQEGFKDNSNNFSILKNNKIYFSEYTLVSLIKYPEEVYSEHKDLLKKLTDICIEEANGDNVTKTTIGSKIMDLADTISYGGSDIVDGFTTGYTVPYFKEFIEKCIILSAGCEDMNKCFIEISENITSKRVVRTQMALIKLLFVNNVVLNNNIIEFEHPSYKYILGEMNTFSYKYFIKHEKVVRSRNIKNKKFKRVIEKLIERPELIPSNLYRKKYNLQRTSENKLKVIRDCIGDMSDDYVIKLYKKWKKEDIL